MKYCWTLHTYMYIQCLWWDTHTHLHLYTLITTTHNHHHTVQVAQVQVEFAYTYTIALWQPLQFWLYKTGRSHRWRNHYYLNEGVSKRYILTMPQKGWVRFDVSYTAVLPHASALRTLWRVMESSTVFCSWLRLRMRTSPPLLSAQARDSSEEWIRQ